MASSMTPYMVNKARGAGIPASLDGDINRLLAALDRYAVSLAWDAFLALLQPDPPNVLKQCLDFVGTFEPPHPPVPPGPGRSDGGMTYSPSSGPRPGI